jgi:hypothetical protein
VTVFCSIKVAADPVWLTRRYFLGSFNRNLKRTYESIVHYTNGAVTLNLNFGPFRYHQLGVSTLYRFLQEPPSGEVEVRFDRFALLHSLSHLVFSSYVYVLVCHVWTAWFLCRVQTMLQCETGSVLVRIRAQRDHLPKTMLYKLAAGPIIC